MTKDLCLAHSGIEKSIENIEKEIREIKEDGKETKEILLAMKTKLDTLEVKAVPAPAPQLTQEEVSAFRNIMINKNGWVVVVVGLLEAILRIKP